MKRIPLFLLLLSLSFGLFAQILTCYDVQYTTATSGNSPYMNQTVTVTGIVSGVKVGTGFFLSDPEGGPWSGLYIYGTNASNQVNVGDEINVTGPIIEFSGLTEMSLPTALEVLSSGNPVPPAVELSTDEIAYNNRNSEQWEGVLVTITDVIVTTLPDSFKQWRVKGQSGTQSMVDDLFFTIDAVYDIVIGDNWHKITGFVDQHTSAGYKLNPRTPQDMIKENSIDNVEVKIGGKPNAETGELYTLPLTISPVSADWGVESYDFTLQFESGRISFEGIDIENTLTEGEPLVQNLGGGRVKISYDFSETLSTTGTQTLINLIFKPKEPGNISVGFAEFYLGDAALSNLNAGSVVVQITKDIAHLAILTEKSGKNIFNPYEGEKIIIEYGTKQGAMTRAIIRIYDAQGRLVATPVHKNFTSSSGFESYEWDGRDSSMKRLEPGVYYCHAEISDRATGKRHRTMQPIVVKSRLK